MKFRLKKYRGFCDTNKIYDDKVVARRMNGYIVEHIGEECFLCRNDIEIIEISDEEQNANIRW